MHRLCAKPGHWAVGYFRRHIWCPCHFPTAWCRYRFSFASVRLKTSWSYFSPLFLAQIQFGSVTLAQGHFRSHSVACGFCMPKTSYRSELNQCGWSHCVQLAKTQKLIRILTASVTTWPWIHMAQGHTLTLNFQCQQMRVSMGFDERNTMLS